MLKSTDENDTSGWLSVDLTNAERLALLGMVKRKLRNEQNRGGITTARYERLYTLIDKLKRNK